MKQDFVKACAIASLALASVNFGLATEAKKCCEPKEPVCCEKKVVKKAKPAPVKTEVVTEPEPVVEKVVEKKEVVIPQESAVVEEVVKTETKSTNYIPGLY
jgi:hypothetical protein